MKGIYHRKITMEALQDEFGLEAMEAILSANLGQDSLRGQIGHHEYHFDANAFNSGWAYFKKNQADVVQALEQHEQKPAWKAFGHLTHAVQDFYAHTNYVVLWQEQFSEQDLPSAEEIDPLDESVLADARLRSGKIYYPFEALTYISWLKKVVLPFMPRDSHAWMNLDAPEQGSRFYYAFSAAVKRTRYEFKQLVSTLPTAHIQQFLQKDDENPS